MNDMKRLPAETLAAALAAGARCPERARLVMALAGELAAPERERLLAHAATCPACAAELELARGFERAASAEESEDVAWIVERLRGGAAPVPAVGKLLPMRPRRRPAAAARWSVWAVAACAVLAVGLSLAALRDRRAPGLPERPLEDVVRGGAIAWTTPLGTLTEAPAELAWQTVAGAVRYRVEILDVADRPLLASTTSAPVWALAASERARLETFVLYRVRVVAFDAAGRELAASAASELRLEPAR